MFALTVARSRPGFSGMIYFPSQLVSDFESSFFSAAFALPFELARRTNWITCTFGSLASGNFAPHVPQRQNLSDMSFLQQSHHFIGQRLDSFALVLNLLRDPQRALRDARQVGRVGVVRLLRCRAIVALQQRLGQLQRRSVRVVAG